MKKTWIYYGIFFSDKTKRAILEHAKHWIYEKFNNEIPDDWKIYCDHVTLVFNDGSPKAQEDADFYENHMLNQYVSMNITHIASSHYTHLLYSHFHIILLFYFRHSSLTLERV